MQALSLRVLALAAIALAPGLALAANDYQITINTKVYATDSQTGIRNLMPVGAPATLSFMVDSNNYSNSPAYPTRGYVVDMSTLSFMVNGIALTLDAPTGSTGNVIPMYFVMRNNDPAVDGVFLANNTTFDNDFNVHVPGMSNVFAFNYHQTWNGGTQFNSLNIGENTGTWGVPAISVFQFDLELPGGYIAATFEIPSITIAAVSAVPEPASLALMGLGVCFALAAARRRRQR